LISYSLSVLVMLASIIVLSLIVSRRLRPRICVENSSVLVVLYGGGAMKCLQDLRAAARLAKEENINLDDVRRAILTAFYLGKVFQTIALLAGIGIALQIASLLGW